MSLRGDSGSTLPTPRDLVFDEGNLYVADSAATSGYSGSAIYEFNGFSLTRLNGAGTARGLAFDPDNSLLYYADSGSADGVYSETLAGSVVTEVTTGPYAAQELFVAVGASTPEPGMIVLMLGGLSVSAFGYRRRTARNR